ncbi:MAG: glycoside hydrolase N-terminal domain-containing protein [Verrucomicrobiota bacterium]
MPDTGYFAAPARGFISRKPAANWEHSLLTGNGTMGALVMGNPSDEMLYLSHAALYLPRNQSENPLAMAKHLDKIRQDCLAGRFKEAGMMMQQISKENSYWAQRDPFIGAFGLRIQQPETDVSRYQRAVDFMTAEAHVTCLGEAGTVRRSVFVSRADDVIVVRIAGDGKQTASFSFNGLPAGAVTYNGMPAANMYEIKDVAKSVKHSRFGVEGEYLYSQVLFETQNRYNPNSGYEGLGKIIAKGGKRQRTYDGYKITDAEEILVLVKIRPLLKGETSNLAAMGKELEALPADYAKLLEPHAKAHGSLMSRVSLSLDAPPAERAKPAEDLLKEARKLDAPLAQLERAFDAGRYNIICCTGYNPPNLQGLWSATWLAPWAGSMTVDGNLPCAIAFLSMGNTPELMEAYFRYYDRFMPGFRQNMKELYGMRGFHVPAQLTTSPQETDFSPGYPFLYWHAGAPWACQFYYDHWRYTGDRKFLEERAYPLMKETAAFYEDFLTVTDKNGKVVFVPTFSPENGPANDFDKETAINATMEVGAAKQLLRNAIAAAKELNRDEDLQKKWAELLAKMPPYEVGPDGSFREWLWPGLKDYNDHRHASHFYPLYDEMPSEIVDNPALVKAVGHSGRARMDWHEQTRFMAFGAVQVGLAAAHTADAELAQRTINFLGKNFWSTGMASFHNGGELFNMDLSGGFPYLCASTLVYSDPGLIRFFPARPAQWKSGSLKGVRLRGAITLSELTWDGAKTKAVLVSDKDQTITIAALGMEPRQCTLGAGKATEVNFETR